jgi:hypothetical protein
MKRNISVSTKIMLAILLLGIAAGIWSHRSHRQMPSPSPEAANPVQISTPIPPSPIAVQTIIPKAAIPATAPVDDSSPPQLKAPAITDVIQQKLAAWRLATDLREKFELLEEMRALITDTNAPEIAKSLSDEDLAGQVGIAAMQHWLDSNPMAAAEWIATCSGTTDAQASLVTQFLLANPQGLQNYLAKLPGDSQWGKQMLAAAGFEMAADDPQIAIAFAAQMESSDAKSVFLASAASEWALADSAAAMDWAAKQEDPTLREQLITAVATSASATDPMGAANWIATSVSDPQLLQKAMQTIIPSWMAEDPNAAADWVTSFPPGALRDSSLEALLTYWNTLNPDAAYDWVFKLSDQDMQDQGLAILIASSKTTP